MTVDIPIILTAAGLQPQSPATLRAQLVALVAASNPGYTANLPGSLIEDIASTDVGAITLCDTALVELVNSLTPFGANAFILNQLGNIYGVVAGTASNTSVFVVFTGTVGFFIPIGFTVSDGTFQYTVQDGGSVGSDGQSPPLFCVATVTGSWAIPPGTVVNIVTSVPSPVTLSCANPASGIPGGQKQTEEAYRTSVLQAGLASTQGMTRYLKTLLNNVAGVQARLVSVVQINGGGWEVIVGGGDPYAVATAIFQGLFDITTLVGSTTRITGITKANPGVVTTNLNHGLTDAEADVFITGVLGMTAANGGPYTVHVLTENTFSFGVDTTGFGTWTSGGVVTPNFRNISVAVVDPPNTYNITFVNPPQQNVVIDLVWNTTAVNFVSPLVVQNLGTQALVDYVNALPVGAPMILFELQTIFQEAIASALPPDLLTRMVFTVFINGVSTPPETGTGIIAGDPESFFFTIPTSITIIQG